jgi:hypothetical protein
MVEIRLALPDESFTVGPLKAFVDTGADASIVPLRYLGPLDPKIGDSKFLRSPRGDQMAVFTYVLDVGVAGLRLPSIQVVADPVGDEVIVGRDVLNRLRIVLDGPKGTLEVTG